MPFAPGDHVHLPGLGTGIVREARSGGRYAVAIKGRIVVAADGDLEPAADAGRRQRGSQASRQVPSSSGGSSAGAPSRSAQAAASLDLHGRRVEEALTLVEAFINDAILGGHAQVQIIHGRSGGRIRQAVHRYLQQLSTVAAFRLDPRNSGVTVVSFR